MDPLTHAISGAALARALPGHPLPRRQLVFIILLTMAPDLDIVLRLFSDPLYLQHHRGLTHSLLILPLWAWLIYSLSSRQLQKQPIMPWLISLALLLHICLDLVTTFGTMVFAPLSDQRISFDLLFIIDPLFTACLLLPLLAGLVWTAARRQLAILALALMCAYLTLSFYNQQQAVALARAAQPQAANVYALPLAFSPWYWQLIAEYPDHYARAGVNLKPGFAGTAPLFSTAFVTRTISDHMSRPDQLQWQQFPAMHSYPGLSTLPGTAFYQWFARFPVLLHTSAQNIDFGDLAFGAGAPGVPPSFQLHISLPAPIASLPAATQADILIHAPGDIKTAGDTRAWLIWRADRKSELTDSAAPFRWLKGTP